MRWVRAFWELGKASVLRRVMQSESAALVVLALLF